MMMTIGGGILNKRIAVIAGDGIGPEIVAQARKVLDRVCEKYSHTFTYTDVLTGRVHLC
jgi:3-isopropylmalate dehydrogenase